MKPLLGSWALHPATRPPPPPAPSPCWVGSTCFPHGWRGGAPANVRVFYCRDVQDRGATFFLGCSRWTVKWEKGWYFSKTHHTDISKRRLRRPTQGHTQSNRFTHTFAHRHLEIHTKTCIATQTLTRPQTRSRAGGRLPPPPRQGTDGTCVPAQGWIMRAPGAPFWVG